MSIPVEERTEAQQAVCDLSWVINVEEGGEGDFVIQTNTAYIGRREKEQLNKWFLAVVAVSSHGPNGSLRIHVE